ncbi:alpha/beta hydrolase [Streptomyces sp. JJ66]|uniref:alpha/beta hydrolase n=1 Tax=Streptomyces sp. JJ66 TaxID=2803843 RepID=UPI001C59E735|nr:alpha/beta hydrolase [Streptomyces sp. JJ66]MBW1604351.1 alpha/beta hydrolase [Streptomyces sp. JJ66]
MTQQALPARTARLGRPLGLTNRVEAVLLVLPGGVPASTRRPSPLAASAAQALARHAVGAAARVDAALTAHVLRPRYRGWNGDAAHLAADAAWALAEIDRRYGDVPVCLAGSGTGARAALRTAGHRLVAAVAALATWAPDGDSESVDHLADRQVLFVHGTDDEVCAPGASYRLAERAREVSPTVCRFEVHTERHTLRRYRTEVAALTADFALGALCARDFSRALADAFAAPPPLGLRMPLAAGFGTSR